MITGNMYTLYNSKSEKKNDSVKEENEKQEK